MDADTEGVTIRDWDLAKAKAMAKKSRLTDEALARMAKQVVDFNFRGTSQAGGGRKRMRAAEALSGAAGGMGGVGTRWQKVRVTMRVGVGVGRMHVWGREHAWVGIMHG